MTLREQIIADYAAAHAGDEPSGSMVRILERHRVDTLNPASAEAQRIRADIASREAVSAEAVARWNALRRGGLPIRMPGISTFEQMIRAERAGR